MNRPSLSAMIVANPLLPGPSPHARSWSEDAADYAAFGADGRAIDGDSMRAGDECDYGGHFLWGFKSFQQRRRPSGLEELALDFRRRNVLLLGHVFNKLTGALGSGRPGQDRVDGYTGTGDRFGETAGDGDLSSFRHAVVNHLRGNMLGRLARDKDDASRLFLEHFGKVRTCQAHAAQNIYFKKTHPF